MNWILPNLKPNDHFKHSNDLCYKFVFVNLLLYMIFLHGFIYIIRNYYTYIENFNYILNN